LNTKNFFDKSILLIVISVTFYVGLVLFSDLEEIKSSFQKVKLEYYPTIFLLTFLVYILLGIRYHLFLKEIGIEINLRQSILISFAGQSMFSTFGRAGTIIKSYILKKKFGHSISSTGPIIIIEQILDLLGSVIILLISLIWFNFLEAQIVTGIGIVLIIILLLIIRHKAIFKLLKKIFIKIKFFQNFVDNIDESRNSLLKISSRKVMLKTFSLTMLIKILQIFLVFMIFESLGLNIEILLSGLIYFTSMLAGLFTLLPGGIVVTDSSMLGLLLKNDLDLSLSTITVLITRFITLWFTVIVGLIALKITAIVFHLKDGKT